MDYFATIITQQETTHLLHRDATQRCYTEMLHRDATQRCYTDPLIICGCKQIQDEKSRRALDLDQHCARGNKLFFKKQIRLWCSVSPSLLSVVCTNVTSQNASDTTNRYAGIKNRISSVFILPLSCKDTKKCVCVCVCVWGGRGMKR